jgi:hypothetical protein
MTLIGGAVESTFAQAEDLLLLPAASAISSVPWKDKVYRFPSFQKGKITYFTGPLEHEFDLNYNLYFEKMDFISSSGDTLNITNTREIKAVQISDKWFFHNHKTGYYEVVLSLPIALAVKNRFTLENLGRVDVGYHSVERGESRSEVRGIVSQYDRFYKIRETYFLIDRSNKVHKATRASLLKVFSDHAKQIKSFLLEHQVNFKSRADLLTTVEYCNRLTLSSTVVE